MPACLPASERSKPKTAPSKAAITSRHTTSDSSRGCILICGKGSPQRLASLGQQRVAPKRELTVAVVLMLRYKVGLPRNRCAQELYRAGLTLGEKQRRAEHVTGLARAAF